MLKPSGCHLIHAVHPKVAAAAARVVFVLAVPAALW